MSQTIHRSDYRAPSHLLEDIQLEFDLMLKKHSLRAPLPLVLTLKAKTLLANCI